MGSHSVTCHPTQVNAPRLNPSQKGWYSINLPQRDRRLSWLGWLAIPRWFTHPSTNWAPRRVTALIKTNALPLSKATTRVLMGHKLHTAINNLHVHTSSRSTIKHQVWEL